MEINEKVLIGQIELADNVSISVSANNRVLTQPKKVNDLNEIRWSSLYRSRGNTSTTNESRNVVDSIGINQ